VYCPECRVEYREGFRECSDCHVSLLAGTAPPLPEGPFDPYLELVVVLETNDPFVLASAKEALEDAGIPFFALNEITTLVNDIDPMLLKWIRIQVAGDRAAEAREVLAPLLEPEPGSGEAGSAAT
jgi:hypothetical protein